jgi:arylsulfate sulfotransferase
MAFFLLQTAWIAGCTNPTAGIQPTLTTFGVVTATGNPQVARYTVLAPCDAGVSVDFGPDTAYGLRTGTQRADEARLVRETRQAPRRCRISVLVAGMRAFTTYHMRARTEFADGTQQLDSDRTFTTGGLPSERVPTVAVTRPGGFEPDPGRELFDISNFVGPTPQSDKIDVAAFDLDGNLIWFYDLEDGSQVDTAFPIKILPTGNLLLVVFGTSSGVREINLAGETISQFSVNDVNQSLSKAGIQIAIASLHHDILPLSNGHLILLANTFKTFTDLPGHPGAVQVTGDILIDLDEARRPVWVWSTFDHLDINRQPLSFPDWTHSNAVIDSPGDGNLILSMRHQNWVIKIDYRDGRGDGSILWRLGPGGDFVIPGGSPADFNYAQHYPVLTSSKSFGVFPLMIFDNGNNRIMDSNGTLCDSPGAASCYSRPVIFELDETSKTARILWQDKLPVFSGCCGSIGVLENGDAEFDIALESNMPLASRIQEVTLDSVPQLVWQMDLSGQLAYRAFRIPSLYPGVQWK